LFDDDRLYRQTDPPIPEPPQKKAKQRTPKKGSRSSRRRVSRVIPDTTPEVDSEDVEIKDEAKNEKEAEHSLDYEPDFEGRKWECIAITMDDYNNFLDSIKRSRDPDEKNLYKYITNEVIPVLQQKEEERERKEQRRLKELENVHKLATAKRSSRLAGKAEVQRQKEAAEEAERKRLAELEMAHREQDRQRKLEEVRRKSQMQNIVLTRYRLTNLE
jgi:hypothetical protein